MRLLETKAASHDQLRRQLRDSEARASAAEGRIKELQAELEKITARSADR